MTAVKSKAATKKRAAKKATSKKTTSKTSAKRTPKAKSNASKTKSQAKPASTPDTSKAAPKSSSALQEKPPLVTDALGQVAWLMMKSPKHKHAFLNDLEWLILPPITLGQMRLFHRDGKPFAYATWAMLSDEVVQRMLDGNNRLAPADWQTGPTACLIDFVAPFGGEDALFNHFVKETFGDNPFKAIRRSQKNGGFKIVDINGQ